MYATFSLCVLQLVDTKADSVTWPFYTVTIKIDVQESS